MVGKTSIATRYIKEKFEKIEASNRTINTTCFEKNIYIDNVLFNLKIWDTAGEEKYHSMAPIFYLRAQGAVIIFDVTNRETFNMATEWFHELNNYVEGSPKTILVGNKIDLPDRIISNEEASKLAKQYNCQFLEVSALQGTNVSDIFNILTASIYKSKLKEEENNININTKIKKIRIKN